MRVRPRLPRRRGWRVALAAVLVLLLGWLIAAFVVIVDPTINRPRHADAVVVLGGATSDGRLGKALKLIYHGYSSTLMISAPQNIGYVKQVCSTPIPKVTIICFDPSPATTQGEAREIRTQAQQRGWQTIMVVTSTYHISRARMIIHRCYDGRLVMVDAQTPSLSEWTYNLFYQTGAFAKALVHSGC
jgi:uncharacterized SAM-binding protein YcdF (DUF218 family)